MNETKDRPTEAATGPCLCEHVGHHDGSDAEHSHPYGEVRELTYWVAEISGAVCSQCAEEIEREFPGWVGKL